MARQHLADLVADRELGLRRSSASWKIMASRVAAANPASAAGQLPKLAPLEHTEPTPGVPAFGSSRMMTAR